MAKHREKIEPSRIDPPGQEPPKPDPASNRPLEKDPPSKEPPVKESGRADQEKRAAARASMRFVHDGQIVGLGTGSTAAYAIRFLGERVHKGLKIVGIPTSQRSKELAESLRIPLATFDDYQEIDVAIDGADEFDPGLRLIKGGGGALLREKIVASAAKLFVVIADSAKQVPVLGRFPLPVEVIPFAQALLVKRISSLGASVTLRRYHGNPFITDEGHHILDCQFGQIPDPPALARTLSDLPGVVEHGLFINMADAVLVGKGSEVVELRCEQPGTGGR